MPKIKQGFAANACSLCEKIAVTIGDHRLGGIRYCQTCIVETFSWFQLSDAEKEGVMDGFAKAAKSKKVISDLEKLNVLTSDQLKSISIGEARLRLVDQQLKENERKGLL